MPGGAPGVAGRVTHALLRIAGMLMVAAGLAANPVLLNGLLAPDARVRPVPVLLLELLACALGLHLLLRPDAYRSRWRELTLLLATSALAGLVLETTLRARTPTGSNWAQYDPLVGWDHKRNYTGRFRTSEFDTVIRTNDQGLRESREFPLRTEAFRIAVVGDSFTWGHGVDEHQRFTNLLDDRLGPGTEVINFAVAGFGTDQHLLKIHKDVLRFNPDLLIVAFYLNDLIEVQLEANPFGVPKPRYELEDGALRLVNLPPPYLDLDEWSGTKTETTGFFLWRQVVRPVLVAGTEKTPEPPTVHSFSRFPITLLRTGKDGARTLSTGFALNELLYGRIMEVASRNGMRTLVVEVPFKEYFIPDDRLQAEFGLRRHQVPFQASQEFLQRLSQSAGFAYWSLYDDFAREGGEDNFYREDRHLNARGHALLARLLADRLGGSDLLSADPP